MLNFQERDHNQMFIMHVSSMHDRMYIHGNHMYYVISVLSVAVYMESCKRTIMSHMIPVSIEQLHDYRFTKAIHSIKSCKGLPTSCWRTVSLLVKGLSSKLFECYWYYRLTDKEL